MKKTNIKLKGKLRRYLNWPLYLTIVLILMDVAMYAQDIQMGAEFSGFIVLYVIIVLISNRRMSWWILPHSTELYRNSFWMILRFRMHCWIIIRDFCGWMKNLQRSQARTKITISQWPQYFRVWQRISFRNPKRWNQSM